jgi:hypothetical protein
MRLCYSVTRTWRATLTVALLVGISAPALAQLPAPTNPNLTHFGYYFVNEKNGNDTAFVWPYTNIYVAIPANAADSQVIDWQTPFAAQLQAATVNHKPIYLILGECGWTESCVFTWDAILDVAQNFWGQVAWVEVSAEANLTTPAEMDERINALNLQLTTRGLASRPAGALFTRQQILTTNAILSSGLSFVNIEAYEPCTAQDCSLQNQSTTTVVNDLNSYLATAKNRVRNAGKQIFLTGQAFDRIFWTNMTTLEAIQRPVYLNAYNDTAVIGILMFSYNRGGGTKDHPVLQQAHREIGSVMGLSAAGNVDAPANGAIVSQGFLIGGWAIDRAAIDSPQSSGHGTGVDFVVVWATPTNGNPPSFLGFAGYGGSRPDVGAVYGSQFTNSAWNLIAPQLTPGQYWLSVYPHSSISGSYMNPMVVLVTVQ